MKISKNNNNAKPTAEPPFPERATIASNSKAGSLNPRTDSDLQIGLRPRRASRRRPRTPSLGRLRRAGAPAGRRSRPETPLLKWKVGKVENVLGDGVSAVATASEEDEDETGRRDRRRRRREPPVSVVSARKLAAGLWRLQTPETIVSDGHGKKKNSKLGFEHGIGHERVPLIHPRSSKLYGSEAKEYLQSPGSSSRNGYAKLRPSLQLSNSAMEGVTKWDPVGLKTSDEAQMIYRQMKAMDQQVSAVTVVAALEAELEQAQTRIQELEAERRSSKKKLDHFLRKVSEEKTTWRSREHEKVRIFIEDLKTELNRERKTRQRTEILNSKLVNELADAKLSAKRLMQDYEKERKARELIEEVCDELAKEIGEDKAEVEAMKRESVKMREEVDDERKMLQMAEVWREERVQMKLVDAKVALEEKYSQMNRIIADLNKLIHASRDSNPDPEEAESLRRIAGSVDVRDIKEFSYEPPNPDDIFSVFEEVNFGGDSNDRERDMNMIEQYSPASHASRIHTVTPENKNRVVGHGKKSFSDRNGCREEEDESGWETVSHAEDQGSSFSPEGSAPSVNKNRRTEWNNEEEEESESESESDRPTEITEVCLAPATKQFVKKGSSIARLWRSRSNGIVSVDGINGGRISNAGTMSPDDQNPGEVLEQWSSPDSGETGHAARGINRCIPRPGQKHSLKAKLLEARMESQKVQLRHVLKQKY